MENPVEKEDDKKVKKKIKRKEIRVHGSSISDSQWLPPCSRRGKKKSKKEETGGRFKKKRKKIEEEAAQWPPQTDRHFLTSGRHLHRRRTLGGRGFSFVRHSAVKEKKRTFFL